MEEAKRGKRLPKPDFETEEVFTPIPQPNSPPEWRNVRHGLNSMDLLVNQKLGGKNTNGKVEWVANEQLLIQLSDPNTLRIRWNIDEEQLPRFGFTEPRVKIAVWRY